MTHSTEEETPPLVTDNKKLRSKPDKIAILCIQAGLIVFVSLFVSVLAKIPFNVFTFHRIFMTLFVVLVTEGIALLQPTATAEEKKKGLLYHAFFQSASYLSAIAGFSFISYKKVISGYSYIGSVHGLLGFFVFVYLALQLVFGITIAFVPRMYGSVGKAKSLWKYHRVFGYILLILVWIQALLGIRTDYIYYNLYIPHLIWLYWVSLFLVVGGLIGRIRFTKWGISSNIFQRK